MTCVIDISLLQFGQLSIVGTTEHARLVLMTLPFARQNVAASKRLTLDRVPVSLKSKSWNWLGRFGLDHQYYCAPIIHRSRAEKKQVTTLVGCLATQQLPSDNHFVICGPKLALVLLTEARPHASRHPRGDTSSISDRFCATAPRLATSSATARTASSFRRKRLSCLIKGGSSRMSRAHDVPMIRLGTAFCLAP